MQFVYPYEIEAENGIRIVSFPDVPGALTQVDSGSDFDAVVADCLVAALGGYAGLRKRPPRPSPARGRPVVALDVLISAKLALLSAMVDAGITNVDLAQRLGISEKAVRRLLDPDHHSRIDRLETALACLGRRLELAVRPARCDSHSPAQA